MARRKKTYRYRTRTKRVYSRARGFGKGGMVGNVLDGAMVGVIQGVIPDNALWGFGDSLAVLGVGWFRKNATLQTIGGYQLGLKLASGITQNKGGAGGFVSQV